MPDITMCKGTGCPLAENCYRYWATPSEYQTYFSTPPVEDGKCEYHWNLPKPKILDKQNGKSKQKKP